jgi:hypothetical protein
MIREELERERSRNAKRDEWKREWGYTESMTRKVPELFHEDSRQIPGEFQDNSRKIPGDIPDTRNQSKRERAGASAPAPADDLAEQAKTIVEAYPRREKTAEALSVVLGALRTGESYAAMLAGTRACAAVIRTMPSAHLNRYVPGALAFFVSRRWADDPETLRRQGNQATGQGIRSEEEVKQMLGNRANEGDEGTF